VQRLSSLTAFVLLISSHSLVFAQLAKSSAARKPLDEYNKGISQLDGFYRVTLRNMEKRYAEEATQLKERLLAQLEDARKQATLADKLDEALELRNLQKEHESVKATPPGHVAQDDSTAELRKVKAELADLRRTHQELLAQTRAQTEQEKKKLATSLPGTRWQWSGGSDSFHFGPDTCWISDLPQLKNRWTVVSGHVVEIVYPDGRRARLTLDASRAFGIFVFQDGTCRSLKLRGR